VSGRIKWVLTDGTCAKAEPPLLSQCGSSGPWSFTGINMQMDPCSAFRNIEWLVSQLTRSA
jgi:hypothetical protein